MKIRNLNLFWIIFSSIIIFIGFFGIELLSLPSLVKASSFTVLFLIIQIIFFRINLSHYKLLRDEMKDLEAKQETKQIQEISKRPEQEVNTKQYNELFLMIATVSRRLEDNLQRTLDLINTSWNDTSGVETHFASNLNDIRLESKTIFESAQNASNVADNLANTANSAFTLSEEVQQRMKSIITTINQSTQQTKLLENKSLEIKKILDVMGDISSKTQVLSINASIVSARAGIHGKGFDVVAGEIRKLSEGTDKSLKDIEKIIQEIQNLIKSVVDQNTLASEAINKEKQSIMTVSGSLQGVTLGVEVVRTMSNSAMNKTRELDSTIESVEDQFSSITESKKKMDSLTNENQQRTIQKLLAELRKVKDNLEKILEAYP